MYPEILYVMAEDLLDLYHKQNLKLALAESCTGGLITGCLTSVPGSSAVVDRTFVTYTNQSKMELLDVPKPLFYTVGAVSEEVARAMAEGVLRHSIADVSASVTGIAGPGGATENKPLGLIHIACARKGFETRHERHVFKGDRHAVRIQAVESTLKLLINMVS
ncbi:MAG: CinA family protein [Alphaproteobacteria bacterium]|nr:CinA family protein [Alphaproteobacteria bacterium]MBF0248991.1 CinA family protein [Alphaproteobacteria bacterium]